MLKKAAKAGVENDFDKSASAPLGGGIPTADLASLAHVCSGACVTVPQRRVVLSHGRRWAMKCVALFISTSPMIPLSEDRYIVRRWRR